MALEKLARCVRVLDKNFIATFEMLILLLSKTLIALSRWISYSTAGTLTTSE